VVKGGVAEKVANNNDKVCVLGETVWAPSVHAPTIGCRFFIHQMESWMYLGLVNEATAVEKGFVKSAWSKLGHGHYAVYSGGGTYSHSDERANEKNSMLKFKAGDTIEMKLDTKSMMLRVACQGKDCTLQVAHPTGKDRYRMVVYLNDKGDSVELIG
jgi:hypothetical protein